MEFVGIPMQMYDNIYEQYTHLLETDPVNNFSAILTQYQKVKDLYFGYMQQWAEQMSNGYSDLATKLQAIKSET